MRCLKASRTDEVKDGELKRTALGDRALLVTRLYKRVSRDGRVSWDGSAAIGIRAGLRGMGPHGQTEQMDGEHAGPFLNEEPCTPRNF